MKRILLLILVFPLLFSCSDMEVETAGDGDFYLYVDFASLKERGVEFSIPLDFERVVLSSFEGSFNVLLEGPVTRPMLSMMAFYLGFDSTLSDGVRVYGKGGCLVRFIDPDKVLMTNGKFALPECRDGVLLYIEDDEERIIDSLDQLSFLRGKGISMTIALDGELKLSVFLDFPGIEETRAVLRTLRLKAIERARRTGERPDYKALDEMFVQDGSSLTINARIDEEAFGTIFNNVLGDMRNAVL